MSSDGWEVQRTLRALLPRGARYAEPPFFGYLEEARPGAQVGVSGWIFNRGSDIVGLWARFDGGPEAPLVTRLLRPDLERAFPGEPRASLAGFRGALPHAGSRLEIWAELSTGQRRRAFVLPLRRPLLQPVVTEVRKRLLLSRVRARFDEILERACGDQFPRISTAEVWDALCRGWAESGQSWAALEAALDPSPISPPRAAEGGAANGRTLFVSGMFPSTAHGGGLRLFDILHHLSQKSRIDLYSVYREDLDGPSLARLSPRLAAARLVRSDELAAADVEAWLKRLGRDGYDAVHFEYPQTAPLIATLRRHGRRGFFTMVECLTLAALIDVDRARTGAELAAAAVQFARRYAVERSALDAAHHGIAVTTVDAEFARRCFGASPLLVPTCVSDEEIRRHLRPGADPAGRSALFVGYFDHYPNVDALAWYLEGVHARVAARLPGYRLRVVGRGNLSHLRARWGADAHIDWVGPVGDLVLELEAARIGLAPVVSGAGIRGKINQHAAAGRPTVSTSIGAFGLPYRHGESILVADSPAAFADAVADLLSDDALWRRLSARCRQLVDEHFAWSSALRPLEALHGA